MATNRDLFRMCREKKFREDLLWRMREFVISVPPLRDQADAIETIADNILKEIVIKRDINLEVGDPDSTFETYAHTCQNKDYQIPILPVADLDFARAYEWPGNVRHLHHAIMRWLVSQGKKAFQNCAQEIESELVQSRFIENNFREQVFQMLDDAIKLGRPVAQTPNDYIDSNFLLPVREALVEYIDQKSPRPRVLESMFPGYKDANSLRTTIGKWRKKQ